MRFCMRLCDCISSTVLLSEPLQQVGQLNRNLEKSNKMLRRLKGLIDFKKDLRSKYVLLG